jgi:hypothetical protein
VDVRDDASARDGALDERVELLVPADGELQVARGDALDLEVLAGVAGQLQDLGGQVLEDGGGVDGGGGAHAAVGGRPRLEVAVDTAHRELRTRVSAKSGRFAQIEWKFEASNSRSGEFSSRSSTGEDDEI